MNNNNGSVTIVIPDPDRYEAIQVIKLLAKTKIITVPDALNGRENTYTHAREHDRNDSNTTTRIFVYNKWNNAK